MEPIKLKSICAFAVWCFVATTAAFEPHLTEPRATISRISPKQVKRVGETVELECFVQSTTSNYHVTWLKKESSNLTLIISVGPYMYIGDPRFKIRVNSTVSLYALEIKQLKSSDSGTFQCQLTLGSNKNATADVELRVLEANNVLVPVTAISVNSTKIPGLEDGEISSTILNKTETIIQSTQLQLYKQKTQLSLNFLNKMIPVLQSIRHNMSQLLTSISTDPSISFSSYKQNEDNLDDQMILVENQVQRNRLQLQQYSEAYGNAEEQLKAVHETLGNILLPVAMK